MVVPRVSEQSFDHNYFSPISEDDDFAEDIPATLFYKYHQALDGTPEDPPGKLAQLSAKILSIFQVSR